ncbi:MAG: hypothetical protein RMM31_04295 [Anaerolineae bacterium]|nr:hypothetical protein [Anaerolineae bacterium]
MDPIIYPILICAGSLVISTLMLTYAVSSVTMAVRQRRAEAVKSWRERGVEFRLGPVQVNFLNEPRMFGVGGNGTLVMSGTAIHFAQVSPKREIVIPLRDIERAFIARRFNGRVGGPFLIIQRKIGDLTGFQMPNPQKWAEAINTAVAAPVESSAFVPVEPTRPAAPSAQVS